jgi:hypothetical protein
MMKRNQSQKMIESQKLNFGNKNNLKSKNKGGNTARLYSAD